MEDRSSSESAIPLSAAASHSVPQQAPELRCRAQPLLPYRPNMCPGCHSPHTRSWRRTPAILRSRPKCHPPPGTQFPRRTLFSHIPIRPPVPPLPAASRGPRTSVQPSAAAQSPQVASAAETSATQSTPLRAISLAANQPGNRHTAAAVGQQGGSLNSALAQTQPAFAPPVTGTRPIDALRSTLPAGTSKRQVSTKTAAQQSLAARTPAGATAPIPQIAAASAAPMTRRNSRASDIAERGNAPQRPGTGSRIRAVKHRAGGRDCARPCIYDQRAAGTEYRSRHASRRNRIHAGKGFR